MKSMGLDIWGVFYLAGAHWQAQYICAINYLFLLGKTACDLYLCATFYGALAIFTHL